MRKCDGSDPNDESCPDESQHCSRVNNYCTTTCNVCVLHAYGLYDEDVYAFVIKLSRHFRAQLKLMVILIYTSIHS